MTLIDRIEAQRRNVAAAEAARQHAYTQLPSWAAPDWFHAQWTLAYEERLLLGLYAQAAATEPQTVTLEGAMGREGE